MIFKELHLSGAFLITAKELADERGFFARVWCQREFENHGLVNDFVQCNISFNHEKGTLRGMHFQNAPHEEVKLIRCTKGRIHDVLIDLRPDSPTFRQSYGVELNEENRWSLYAPRGFAHGFLTLEPDTEVFYQISEFYQPDAGRGIRWNDPAFGIEWPGEIRVIIARDQNYPDFTY